MRRIQVSAGSVAMRPRQQMNAHDRHERHQRRPERPVQIGPVLPQYQDSDTDQHEGEQGADVHQLAQELQRQQSGGESHRDPGENGREIGGPETWGCTFPAQRPSSPSRDIE